MLLAQPDERNDLITCNPPELPAPTRLERWVGEEQLEIPCLDLLYQATSAITPMVPWGSIKRSSRMEGTWHFYTDDYRFNALYRDPARLVNTHCSAAVEPNYSTYNDMPMAEAIFRTYQKRWIARYWQSRGINVYVDLNVSRKFYELNLLGVPYGWRSYSTRGYNDRVNDLEAEYWIAKHHSGDGPINFIVFGGGKIVSELCQDINILHIKEYREVVKYG